jgi:hypothetical protein
MWRELAFMLDQLDSNCPKLGTTEFGNCRKRSDLCREKREKG